MKRSEVPENFFEKAVCCGCPFVELSGCMVKFCGDFIYAVQILNHPY